MEQLPLVCQKKLSAAIERTKGNTRLTVILALSYSGRLEIVDAVRRIVAEAKKGRVEDADITPDFIGQHLYTAGVPDPDLLIRTSGEMRLSNFLLWQLSYTEIHVTPKFWPEFQKADFAEALADFAGRNRRYGGV